MQRMFSMFPGHGPGLALLILRVCVAVMLGADAWSRFGATGSWLPGAVAGGVAVLLALGLLTPAACAVAFVVELWAMVGHPNWSLVTVFAQLAALALLGPGAFSVDCWLFGRRQIVWPAKH